MKNRPTIALLTVPIAVAAYMTFHPGVAFAETPLSRLAPTILEESAAYTVDGMHTCLGFEIGHLGLSKVQGRFDKLSGKLNVDSKDLANSSVQFTAQTDSVDTNVAPRDADLRSPNFFDVAKFPELSFKSTKIFKQGKSYLAEGELTIKGVTKSVKLPFKAYGPIKDPWGNLRIGVVAEPIVLHRSDYGMKFDADSVADEVTVRISLEATQDK
ncbi:MAG: YceI family protein [Fimbriimonas sp.]|nr:YceI family protein [Fimbriimonas sp.]